MKSSSDATEKQIEWPGCCQYFSSRLHNADHARHLLLEESQYFSHTSGGGVSKLTFVDLKDGRAACVLVSPDDPDFADLLDVTRLPPESSRLIFIPQKRFYTIDTTVNQFWISLEVWLQILQSLQVPSFAVELLQDNNGGTASYTSYCTDNPKYHCNEAFTEDKPCAYHICLKQGVSSKREYCVYARHDFHTKANMFLVLGTFKEGEIQGIHARLEDHSKPCLISVLLLLLDSWAGPIETNRWEVDVRTRKLESETGFALFQRDGTRPLSPEQLTVRKDIALAQDVLGRLLFSAKGMLDLFSFLRSHIETYRTLCVEHGDRPVHRGLDQQLRDACSQRMSQVSAQVAQMEVLQGRVEAQWTVVNALMGQHNSRLSIEMARDARAESRLMRRIAFVTIVFLPATFMATFFSMAFFIIDRSGISVSKWIWLYFVFTIPLTVILSQQYGVPEGGFRHWLSKLRRPPRDPEPNSTPWSDEADWAKHSE